MSMELSPEPSPELSPKQSPDHHGSLASLSASHEESPPLVSDLPPQALGAMLDHAATNFPHRPAYIFQGKSTSYAQLLVQAERVAASLREAGLETGDRVALILPNLPQTLQAFWGVIKAGGVVVMTNPLYMEKELVHQLTDSGAKFVIALDAMWPKLAPLRDQVPVKTYFITRIADTLPFLAEKIHNFKAKRNNRLPHVPFDNTTVRPWKPLLTARNRYSHTPEDPLTALAALQYTGGTTGVSKGVMLTHANLGTNAYQLGQALEITEAEEHGFLAVLPLFHVYGLVTCLLLPVRIAAAVLPVPRYVPQEMLELIKRHAPTIFPGAPSIYISLMQQKSVGQYNLQSIRCCISGSAPMPVEKFSQFTELTGARIVEGYGLTEASPVTHLNPIDGSNRNGSIGRPIPFTEARVVDMEVGSLPVPSGVPGELLIRGPQVMLGYWNNPDETASALRNGWLYTGDIARMDEDGFYYILDRKKDMYIVGGYNVYPREIDEVLAEHPKIYEAVAVGVPHGTRGETIKAFIVPKPGEELTKEEVIAHCRQKLASYKVPRMVEFREELPKSAVGKILRRLLLNEELQRKESKRARNKAQTPEAEAAAEANAAKAGDAAKAAKAVDAATSAGAAPLGNAATSAGAASPVEAAKPTDAAPFVDAAKPADAASPADAAKSAEESAKTDS